MAIVAIVVGIGTAVAVPAQADTGSTPGRVGTTSGTTYQPRDWWW